MVNFFFQTFSGVVPPCVRYAQPLESKLKLFAESAAFSYAENV